MDNSIKEKIKELKEKNDVVILAHYYVDGEVQEISDYVGDSFYLAKVATTVKQQTILFCGVSFMGESAKILNPQKKVIMADNTADCPMAHMVDIDRIREVRRQYDDVAVVCYVNSTAEIKAESDVCVTSSNAVTIVKKLPNRNIFFIPITTLHVSWLNRFLINTLSLMMVSATFTKVFTAKMSLRRKNFTLKP